jgi:pyruvate formate lyase activating enzyme
VTFSGGEPLWQAGFVAQVARNLKNEGIHTALDTAGHVGWCRFEEVLPYIDLVLYDIKAADQSLHRQLTGQENDVIVMNAQLLAQHGMPMHVRLVLIPGLNDSEEEIKGRMQIVSELTTVQQVDLLPYHRYGIGKYARLGLDYPLMGVQEYSEERLAAIEALVRSYGIPTTIGG